MSNNSAAAASECHLLVRDLHGRVIKTIDLPNQATYELDLIEERASLYWIEIYKGEQRIQVLKALKI